MAPERALIYIPPGDENIRWLDSAARYVTEHGYRLLSVVRDWSAVELIAYDQREAEVIVAVLKDHPPANRTPRIEYVEEEGPAPAPRQRRPRLSRRDEAAGPA